MSGAGGFLKGLWGTSQQVPGFKTCHLPTACELRSVPAFSGPREDETEIALPTGNKNRNRETNPCILISVQGTPVIWAAVASNILPREAAAKDFPCWEEKTQTAVTFHDGMICGLFLSFLSLLFSFHPLMGTSFPQFIPHCSRTQDVVCQCVTGTFPDTDNEMQSLPAEDFPLASRRGRHINSC